MKWNWRDLALRIIRPYWLLRRPLVVGVRGILQDEQGRLLFVRHNYGRRHWILPGGGRQGNESPDVALVREMREETGLEVEVTRLVGAYLYLGNLKRDHIFIFECRRLAGEVRVDGGEIAEAGWFHPDELPENVFPGIAEVLATWQQGKTGYGYWPGRD
ncbi:MAG: NUDIX domain-containing protein [Caldilineae bacterium]|nr:MAG: NUDIX domain-containing protein [Caldilineae bacterium]